MIIVIAMLIIMGLLIGLKSQKHLIYIFLILYPFSYFPNLKYIDLSIFKVIFYLCTLPMAVILVKQFIRIKDKKLILSVALFYGYFLLCFSQSLHPDKAYIFVAVTSGIIVFLFVFYNCISLDRKLINKITKGIIYFEAFIVILQQMGIKVQDLFLLFDFNDKSLMLINLEGLSRATGTFADSNYFSLYMAVLIGSLFIKKGRGIELPMIAGIGAIVLSFSRMGFVLSGILLLYYIRYNMKAINYKKLSVFFLSSSLLILLIGFVVNLTNNLILKNILARFHSDTNIFDASGRGAIIEGFFKNMLKLPDLLWGYGFENFRFVLKKYIGVETAAHNQYIQFLSDFGIIGVVLFTVILWILFRGNQKSEIHWESKGLLPVILILIGNLALTTTFEIYIYFYLALFCADYAMLQRSRSTSNTRNTNNANNIRNTRNTRNTRNISNTNSTSNTNDTNNENKLQL